MSLEEVVIFARSKFMEENSKKFIKYLFYQKKLELSSFMGVFIQTFRKHLLLGYLNCSRT